MTLYPIASHSEQGEIEGKFSPYMKFLTYLFLWLIIEKNRVELVNV